MPQLITKVGFADKSVCIMETRRQLLQ